MNINNNIDNISEIPAISADQNNISGEDQSTLFEQVIDENNIRISLIPSKRKKTKKINIVVEGCFTVATTGLAYEKIMPAIPHFDFIDFSLRKIEQIDLVAIQLLYYIKNKYSTTNKTITIEADLSTEDRAVLFNSGLMGLLTKTKLTENK